MLPILSCRVLSPVCRVYIWSLKSNEDCDPYTSMFLFLCTRFWNALGSFPRTDPYTNDTPYLRARLFFPEKSVWDFAVASHPAVGGTIVPKLHSVRVLQAVCLFLSRSVSFISLRSHPRSTRERAGNTHAHARDTRPYFVHTTSQHEKNQQPPNTAVHLDTIT